MPFWVLELLLYGGVVPALSAGTLFGLALRLGGPNRAAAERLGAATAAALAFVLGCRLLELTPWKPEKPYDYLPHLMMVIWLAEGICAFTARSYLVSCGVRAVVAMIAAFLLTPSLPDLHERFYRWRGGVAVAIFVTSWLLDPRRRGGEHGPRLACPLGLISLATAIVIELAGFDTLAEMAGVLAAGLFGIALVAWWLDQPTEGIAGVVAVILPGLIFNTYFYHDSEVPWLSFLLVLLAPSLAGAVVLANQGKPRTHWRAALVWIGVLVPIAVAVLLAALSDAPSAEWQ
jgi:hypothetical protein